MMGNHAGLVLQFVAILRTISFVTANLSEAFFHTKIDPPCQGESENCGMRPEPRWVQGSPALNVVQGGLRNREFVGARGRAPELG